MGKVNVRDMKYNTASSARNTCKLCTPYGAVLALLGIENCVPLLHGSQGCSTYIRRHMIGHFREPVDIASSNFHESQAVFGGRDNLFRAIENVNAQYRPEVIGIATTCLAETIGDNIPMFLHEFRKTRKAEDYPGLVQISTPSYKGYHADGFFAAQKSIVEQFVQPVSSPESRDRRINIIPPIISCEDIRTIKEEVSAFGLDYTLLCDYSERLDGGTWEDYQLIPPGGTSVEDISKMSVSQATIELTTTRLSDDTAGGWIEKNTGVPLFRLPLPVGVRHCDLFYEKLSEISGKRIGEKVRAQRSRLIDAYIDGHKYLFGKKAVVFGEEDMVVAIVSLLLEVGIDPVICATGGDSQAVRTALITSDPANLEKLRQTVFLSKADFAGIEESANDIDTDIIIGNSNGLKLSRALKVPLLRVGIPIHDRIGASRLRMLGYGGTLELFDRLCNLFIQQSQDNSDLAPIGYAHM